MNNWPPAIRLFLIEILAQGAKQSGVFVRLLDKGHERSPDVGGDLCLAAPFQQTVTSAKEHLCMCCTPAVAMDTSCSVRPELSANFSNSWRVSWTGFPARRVERILQARMAWFLSQAFQEPNGLLFTEEGGHPVRLLAIETPPFSR